MDSVTMKTCKLYFTFDNFFSQASDTQAVTTGVVVLTDSESQSCRSSVSITFLIHVDIQSDRTLSSG